jgi:hypothetical protein
MPSKCGFQMDHNISIWSSPNLTSGSWSYVGNSINVADRPAGILLYFIYIFNTNDIIGVVFRPHLVYNPITKLYVLIWNYMRWGAGSLYAVAIAETPR